VIRAVDIESRACDHCGMGNPLDFVDEGGWPYPDDGDGDGVGIDGLGFDGARRVPGDRPAPWLAEPADFRNNADDDAIALHALTARALAPLSPAERAAVVARFGLDGSEPLSMVELGTALGLSRDRTRAALAGGLGKLRDALSD
jgi:hypothetical protein